MFFSAPFTVPLRNHNSPVFIPMNEKFYTVVCFNGNILNGMGNEFVGSAVLTTGVAQASYKHCVVAHRLSKGQGLKTNRPKLKLTNE